jgi:hypothetical protein
MVRTRRGTTTGRLEDEKERYNNLNRQYIQTHPEALFGEDSEEESNEADDDSYDFGYNGIPRNMFHIGHPHAHPGHYRDLDEHHRHRKRDTVPKTEVVRTYRRRKNLF